MMYVFFFFFFSSRRRHTRWNCDWSSDVCSSDLAHLAFGARRAPGRSLVRVFNPEAQHEGFESVHTLVMTVTDDMPFRSEERRVGKECRCRWSRCDEKKKGKER